MSKMLLTFFPGRHLFVINQILFMMFLESLCSVQKSQLLFMEKINWQLLYKHFGLWITFLLVISLCSVSKGVKTCYSLTGM